MAFIAVGASVDTGVFTAINNMVGHSGAVMKAYQKRRIPQTLKRIRKRFEAPKNTPEYPFIWSYDPAAQRRAQKWWYANKSGPHVRTGALTAATDVQFIGDETGGYFEVSNTADGNEYVIGEKQVPSHYLTGWPTIDAVAEEEAAILNDQLTDDWYYVSTGEGRF